MAGVFVSYTSGDQAWAFWIAKAIEALGYKPFVHEWEIQAGEDILQWMEKRFDEADHALLVISTTYLMREKVYSSWERRSAEWAAAKNPGFALPVYVEKCEAPRLLQNFKRCDLYDLEEDEARAALAAYLAPAGPPPGAVRFPGRSKPNESSIAPEGAPFPGKHAAPPAAEQTKLAPIPAPEPSPAPLAASSLPPNPRMIGRHDRLEELVTAILEEDRPIVVPGALGMGKTTLALASAYDPRVVARFGKERRFFVNLEPAPNAEGVLSRLAADLGLPASGSGPEVEAKIAAACAGQPTLAILDNLETPWRKDMTATEALLGRLAAIEGLRLVITVRGEPPRLPGPGARTLRDVERLSEVDSRVLFLRHAGDHFAADPALPGLLAALDGHPLSIELLAANAQGKRDLKGLAADWHDRRADLLRHGAADDRKTSLRASLDLSLAALDPPSPAHRLIRLMALLPDGMSEADGRTILSDSEPTKDERGAAPRLETARLASRPDGRWRLLAPVRETLLADFPPQADDRARLVSVFLRRAALGEHAGTGKWNDVREELTAEAGNLDAMIGVAARQPELPAELSQAVSGLSDL
ncbi:MAG TPA: TIR domain-containing protein, partial [Roseiarcus sp.]|nr:TIR domain-containing protein [Roseiarcus sp.]